MVGGTSDVLGGVSAAEGVLLFPGPQIFVFFFEMVLAAFYSYDVVRVIHLGIRLYI